MRLRELCGQPVTHETWGWIAGWIHDVWINSRAGRIAAFDVCEADRLQSRYVEPFVVHWSFRYGLGVEADPDEWRTVARQPHWTALRDLDDVLRRGRRARRQTGSRARSQAPSSSSAFFTTSVRSSER